MENNARPSSIELPSTYGTTYFKVMASPVSSQAKRSKKDIFTEEIRKITRPIQNILTGDISVEIIWRINEDERYESDSTADIDNILKPILDALSGPEGIIINDSQVQHLVSTWRDRYDEPEHIEITINYLNDEWRPKSNTMFVQVDGALCMPISKDLSGEALKILLDGFELQIQSRNRLMEMGKTYYEARSVMSIQRLFHRTRVGEFEVKSIDEFRKDLKNV